MNGRNFNNWIRELDEDVIQGEFGYEPGEFSVYPDDWHVLFDEGLSPREAWGRALKGFAEGRKADERAREENWRRIRGEEQTP